MSEIEKKGHKAQCDQMHRAKYCVCCMVECAVCTHVHGAQKEHVRRATNAHVVVPKQGT